MTGPNGVNPPLVSVPLSNAQIARELGISGQTIGVWKREGCPTSSVGAALEWARDNRPHFGKRQAASQEEIPRPLPVVLPPDESVYDVVARLRENERAIAGEVASWLNLSAKLAEDRGKTGGKEALELVLRYCRSSSPFAGCPKPVKMSGRRADYSPFPRLYWLPLGKHVANSFKASSLPRAFRRGN